MSFAATPRPADRIGGQLVLQQWPKETPARGRGVDRWERVSAAPSDDAHLGKAAECRALFGSRLKSENDAISIA